MRKKLEEGEIPSDIEDAFLASTIADPVIVEDGELDVDAVTTEANWKLNLPMILN